MRPTLRFAFVVLVSLGLAVPVASAQTTTQTTTSSTSSSGGASTLGGPRTVESGHALSDDQAAMEEANPRPAADNGISPRLDATDHDYFSVGYMVRGIVIPDFVINWFVDFTGPSAFNAGMGGFFAFRRNGLTVTAEVWYGGFGAQGYYRGHGANDRDIDYVNSQLGVVFGNFVFQWAVPVNEWFAIDVGIGLGLGGVVGNMQRQDGYSLNVGGGAPYGVCAGPGQTPTGPTAAYCPPPGSGDDGTYQITNRTNNGMGFGSGLIPPIFPWLDLPRVTFRFTPIRQLVARIDLSYSVYSFNFGGSVGYQF
jgi:hypothetical protein